MTPIPTTREEWAAIVPNETDIRIAEQHMRYMNDGHEPYAPAVYAWARGMAASRIAGHERCVERLVRWMNSAYPDCQDSPRRILEDR